MLGFEAADPWSWDCDPALWEPLASQLWADLSVSERALTDAMEGERLAYFALAGKDFGLAPELAEHRQAARLLAFCEGSRIGRAPSPLAPATLTAAVALGWGGQFMVTRMGAAWGWATLAAIGLLAWAGAALRKRSLASRGIGEARAWGLARKVWPEFFAPGQSEARIRSLASYWALPPELKALAPPPKSPWLRSLVCQEELGAAIPAAPSKPRRSL